MSVIRIRGRTDPLVIDYTIAKKVKQRWGGDPDATPPVQKATKDAILDLGDVWCGTYGQIAMIELTDKPRPKQLASPEDTEPFDKEMHKIRMAEIGEKLKSIGLIKKNDDRRAIQLTRSGLNEYKEKFGKEYQLPANAEIIEDVT